MRLLFISALYPPLTKGGGELSTHFIAQGLRARGHHVEVLTAGQRSEHAQVDGIPIRKVPVPITAKPLLEQRASRRIAAALDNVIGDPKTFDVIHAHDFRSAQALSELNYSNTIVTARDYAQICGSTNNILANGRTCTCSWPDVLQNQRVAEASLWRKPFRIWQYRYNLSYRKSSFRTFPHQIFISHAQEQLIASQQDLAGVAKHVIYNPVSLTYLSAQPVAAVSKNLLYVGRVEMYKGVGVLLHAFRRIAERHPDLELKIVGEGAQRVEYERLVSRWGLQYQVKFIGRIPWDRLQRLYDEAAIVVAPHIWVEPFGRTVVEAMARAKLVVTSSTGGPGEIVQDGITGFLAQPNNVASLTAAIKKALLLPLSEQRTIQQAARDWVKSHLTPDLIAAQHEDVYKQLVP